MLGEDREHHEEQLDLPAPHRPLGGVVAAVRHEALDEQLRLDDLLERHLLLRSEPLLALGGQPDVGELAEHVGLVGQPCGHPLHQRVHEHDPLEAQLRLLQSRLRRERRVGHGELGVKGRRDQRRRRVCELVAQLGALGALDERAQQLEVTGVAQLDLL